MRHDETWKLETEPRQDIQVSRHSQEKPCIETVSKQDMRDVSRDSITCYFHWSFFQLRDFVRIDYTA